MKRTIAAICLIAAVGVVGAFVWVASSDTPKEVLPATATAGTDSGSPEVSAALAANSTPAEKAIAVNKIIVEVTQEAVSRPSDQRMSAAEVEGLIRSRIKQILPEL